jgi:L-ascorbate 6-phosphate lactonase
MNPLLCTALRAMRHRFGCVTLAFLGQSGVLLSGYGGSLVAIDPYLSNSVALAEVDAPRQWERLEPPPLDPLDLDVDIVLITHEHPDHFDPASLSAHGRARRTLVAPPQLRGRAESLGVNFRSAIVGEPIGYRGISVTPVEAEHSLHPRPKRELDNIERGRFVGYIIRFEDGSTIYHSGDTFVTPSLTNTIRSHEPGLIILPINGRSAEREAMGVVGNMEITDALQFGTELGSPWLLPCHHDMFIRNGASLDDFMALAASVGYARVVLPIPGKPIVVYTL